jgi:tRNA A37 threonylcarbamoyladenosine biosynthesis protein TsaE
MHLDLYNVKSPTEMEELGIYDYLNSPDGVCLIEWWDLFPDFFSNTDSIQIEIKKENETRVLTVKTQEKACQAVLDFLSKSEDFHG